MTRCSLCGGKGYHENGCKLKYAEDKITIEVSPYHVLTANFKSEKFPGEDLMDTSVEFEPISFCISWPKRHEFMSKIAKVIEEYLL